MKKLTAVHTGDLCEPFANVGGKRKWSWYLSETLLKWNQDAIEMA